MSRFLHLKINNEFLASDNITLVSQGPKAVRSVSITIKSNRVDFVAVLVFLIQAAILLLASYGLLQLLIAWSFSRPTTRDMSYTDDLDAIDLEVLAEIAAEGEQQQQQSSPIKKPELVLSENLYEKIVEVPEEEAEQEDEIQENPKAQAGVIEDEVVQPRMIDSDVEEVHSEEGEGDRAGKKESFEMT